MGAHLDLDNLRAQGLVSAREARKLLGGITPMSEWRWRKAGLLPEPIKIRRRCFYRSEELHEALKKLRADGAIASTPPALEQKRAA
jgi:hypothetical protein